MYTYSKVGGERRMELLQLAEKATKVRQHWSSFVDDVIHKFPKFVQRNERDIFMSINLEHLSVLIENVRYKVTIEYDQESNEYIGTMDDFWFVENGKTKEETIRKLAEELQQFSTDYFKEITIYNNTPDFNVLFPKVLKALINDVKGIIDYFDVEYV